LLECVDTLPDLDQALTLGFDFCEQILELE
jgi:hypothetical protein